MRKNATGKTLSPFETFRRFTKKLVAVPKSEIDKRAATDKRGPVVKTKV